MGPSGKWGWPRLYWNETLFSKSKGPQSNRPRPREATPVALSKVARGLPTRLNKTSNFFRWEFQTLGFWSHVFRAWLRLRKIKVNQGFDPPPRPEFHAVYDVELGFWSWQGDWKLVGALRGHRLWRARAEISLYSWCGGMLSFLEMTHRQSPPRPTACWWPTAMHWRDSIHMARTPDWCEWACLPNAPYSHPCIQLGCLFAVPSHGGLYSGLTTKLYFLHSHGASSVTAFGWQNIAEETLSKSWAHTSDVLLSSASPRILPYELGPA